METITKTQIQTEAKELQRKDVSYTQALEEVAKKYGFTTYAALKAVVLDKNCYANPLNIEFSQEWLDLLLEKGSINNYNKNDLNILCWSKRLDPAYRQSFNYMKEQFGYFKEKSEKDLNFAQKVANSISMMGLSTAGYMTGRGSSYTHRDYIVSDFDLDFMKTPDDIFDSIVNYHKNSSKSRIRGPLDNMSQNKVEFVEFNFKKEETTIYVKNFFRDKNNIKLYKNIFTKKYKLDVILPFVNMEVFPFYNVSKIVLIPYLFCKEGIEITKKGVKNINFDDGHFNLGNRGIPLFFLA